MTSRIIAYHGTTPDAPLFGGQDPVSSRRLEVLWASDSYDLAAQFQDGQIRKFAIRLSNPAIVSDEDRKTVWNRQGHAAIVDRNDLADILNGPEQIFTPHRKATHLFVEIALVQRLEEGERTPLANRVEAQAEGYGDACRSANFRAAEAQVETTAGPALVFVAEPGNPYPGPDKTELHLGHCRISRSGSAKGHPRRLGQTSVLAGKCRT